MEMPVVCPAALSGFFSFQDLAAFVALFGYHKSPFGVTVISFIFVALSPKLMRNVYAQA